MKDKNHLYLSEELEGISRLLNDMFNSKNVFLCSFDDVTGAHPWLGEVLEPLKGLMLSGDVPEGARPVSKTELNVLLSITIIIHSDFVELTPCIPSSVYRISFREASPGMYEHMWSSWTY